MFRVKNINEVPQLNITEQVQLTNYEKVQRPPAKSKLDSRRSPAIPSPEFLSKMPFIHKPKTKVP